MRSFRDRPINEKLLIVTLVTTVTALALAGFGIVVLDSLLFRSYLRRDLTVLARVIADNSTASLAFNDPKTAAQTLAAVKERSHIVGACVYHNTAQSVASVFTQYSRNGTLTCPQLGNNNTPRVPAGQLAISEPIVLDGRQIGTIVLLYDLGELNERARLYGSTILAVFLVSMLLALLLSNRMRALIASPVARLVRATTKVSETGDYSVRAEKISGDELGILVDRFNEMLSRIQSRDYDLKTALREVERERARFRFMAESMPQKIYTATPNGEVDYLNRQWLEFTGLAFNQAKG